MTAVSKMMREHRLRYALLREIDRQAAVFSEPVIAKLVSTATQNIETRFADEETRVEQSERAEKTLQPVIAALADINRTGLTLEECSDFLAAPTVAEFPWTARS